MRGARLRPLEHPCACAELRTRCGRECDCASRSTSTSACSLVARLNMGTMAGHHGAIPACACSVVALVGMAPTPRHCPSMSMPQYILTSTSSQKQETTRRGGLCSKAPVTLKPTLSSALERLWRHSKRHACKVLWPRLFSFGASFCGAKAPCRHRNMHAPVVLLAQTETRGGGACSVVALGSMAPTARHCPSMAPCMLTSTPVLPCNQNAIVQAHPHPTLPWRLFSFGASFCSATAPCKHGNMHAPVVLLAETETRGGGV